MRSLGRRLEALERANVNLGWGPILDQLPTSELDRLDTIMRVLGSVEAITADEVLALPAEDRRFLETILAMKPGFAPCALSNA